MKQIKKLNKYFLSLFVIFSFLIISFTSGSAEMDHSQPEMNQPKHKMGAMDDMKKMPEEMNVQMDIAMGKMIYEMACIHCHGAQGRGDGPAASFIGPYSAPRPRDFTYGVFKFRSTKKDDLPREFDLMRTVRDGIPGYMPSFRYMGREKLRQVVLYITQFYKSKIEQKIKKGEVGEEILIDHSVSFTKESIARGEKLFIELECYNCHGMEGKGDGDLAESLEDDWGFPIKPADLTQPSTFKNGNNHEDIYRTIITGLSGSPMPSFAEELKGRESRAWDLVHYILSLSPDEEWTRMGRTK